MSLYHGLTRTSIGLQCNRNFSDLEYKYPLELPIFTDNHDGVHVYSVGMIPQLTNCKLQIISIEGHAMDEVQSTSGVEF